MSFNYVCLDRSANHCKQVLYMCILSKGILFFCFQNETLVNEYIKGICSSSVYMLSLWCFRISAANSYAFMVYKKMAYIKKCYVLISSTYLRTHISTVCDAIIHVVIWTIPTTKNSCQTCNMYIHLLIVKFNYLKIVPVTMYNNHSNVSYYRQM